MINVLSVTSECVPLVKTGGLADVAGALPGALAPLGVKMTTLLPGYPAVMAALGKTKTVARFDDLFGGAAQLKAAQVHGLDLIAVDAPHLFDRKGGPYGNASGNDWPDNPERFAALSLAAAHLAGEGGFDLVHGHDWQAGLVPEYLDLLGVRVPFVLSIHNIAFHGLAPAEKLKSLKLKKSRFTADRFEYWGQISALKAGLMGADRITTVSQTYAEELLTPEFGMGLDGVLRSRAHLLSGIVNGIDTEVWNPATDPAVETYKTPKGKGPAKAALRAEFGLPEAEGPLCVLVSRLTEQKGIDLLIEALPALLDRGGQLALLGTGEPSLEASLSDLAKAHPNMAVNIGYDEALSHRMMAGGDAILVPSRFEPCGLTQLYGLRYGTLPLVSLTGGLADTVINASPAALSQGVATGIQFYPVTSHALSTALMRLLDLFAQPKLWAAMQRNAMKQPVGWETSARSYHALYASLVAG